MELELELELEPLLLSRHLLALSVPMLAAEGVERAEVEGLRRSCSAASATLLATSGVTAITGRPSWPCCSSAECRLQAWDLHLGGAREAYSLLHKLGGSREGVRSLQPQPLLEPHQYIHTILVNMLFQGGSYRLHHHLLRVR